MRRYQELSDGCAVNLARTARKQAITSLNGPGQQTREVTGSMRHRSLLACFASLLLVFTIPGHCEKPDSGTHLTVEQQEALSPLEVMLDGLAKRDTVKMQSVLLPGGSATLLRGGTPVQLTFAAFISFIKDQMKSTSSAVAEPINDPVVHIDHDLAVIWTPYKFLVDGKVEHCGTDVATLARVGSRWLIASLEDNARTSCN